MIPYDPKDAVKCLAAGDYDAVLSGVAEVTSKAGNDMYKLMFTAYSGDGESQVIDYVVFPTFVWKLKRLARAFGVEASFTAGTFNPEEFLDKNLRLSLVIEEQEGYDPKNNIRAYLPASAGNSKPTATPKKAEAKDNDDLPF